MRKEIFTGVVFCAISVVVFTGIVFAGSLEPSAPPAPTMHTLEDIYNRVDLIYTHSTGSNYTRPRFEVLLVDAAIDHNTGLIWQRDTDSTERLYAAADQYCLDLSLSTYSDWRLPTRSELESLVDVSQSPTLPLGHPFMNVHLYNYWTSTTHSSGPTAVWVVGFDNGGTCGNGKTMLGPYVRCVRNSL